ncbi:uncharacterized protein LOC144437885 [Glandiceps talaboti]
MARCLVYISTIVVLVIGFTSYSVSANEMSVVELDARNFDDVVTGQRFAMVEFYAPWCGACKRFAPTYQQIANHFADQYDIIVAKVDAFREKILSKRFKISSFPTLKYFEKGSTEPLHFKGTNKTKIISLIESQVDESDRRIASPISVLTTLNLTLSLQDDKERFWMLDFYHPKIEECRKLYPVFERIASIFKNDLSIVFGRIHLDKESPDSLLSLLQRFQVIHLPTFLWINTGSKQIKQVTIETAASFVLFCYIIEICL